MRGFESSSFFAYGQRGRQKAARKGVQAIKHKVCINITKPDGSRSQVVKGGTMHIRKRVLDFLFGQKVSVLVLSPGDSVQTVEIHEMKEGGKA